MDADTELLVCLIALIVDVLAIAGILCRLYSQ